MANSDMMVCWVLVFIRSSVVCSPVSLLNSSVTRWLSVEYMCPIKLNTICLMYFILCLEDEMEGLDLEGKM